MVFFFFLWVVCIASFALGAMGKLPPVIAFGIFAAAALVAVAAVFIGVNVTRCGGCGKWLFGFRPDPEYHQLYQFRKFDCSNCGDTTYVKGNFTYSESD